MIRKRIILIPLLLAAVFACQKLPDDNGAQPSGEKTEQPEPLDASCELLSLKATASDGSSIIFAFNGRSDTFHAKWLTWIEGTDPELFTLTFETNGKAVRFGGKALENGVSKISLSDVADLVVEAESGDTRTYHVSLNCPQINRELPLLRIRPEKAITSKEEYVDAIVDLSSPFTESGWWSEEDGKVQVRGRGNSTWVLPKKPYRIKFPEKVSPIGLDHAVEKSWVILAHDMDKSLIRNHLGFMMSRILFDPEENYHDPMAILFTPCSQFVNLYMGDDYVGVYQMSDQMNRAEGRIAVEKLTAKDGSDPAKITGGHILETDVHSEVPPVRFSSKVKNIQVNHKYPDEDDHDPAQYAYIENYLAEAETVLYGSNFTDPENGWRRYFDEKTLIDYMIVKELAADMDGYISTYLYKRRGCDKFFFGPVWDVDKGWDNEKRVAADYLQQMMVYSGFAMPGSDKRHWYYRFCEDKSFRKALNLRWRAKRNQLLSAIYKELGSLPARMPLAIEANFTVWPFYYQASTEAKMPEASYEAEIARIKRLTEERAAVLDREFAK